MHSTRTTWLMIVLWAVALPAVAAHLMRDPTPQDRPTARYTLDPNIAVWWELTALPRVGESIARGIVAHREAVRASSPSAKPVFTRPEDLAAVRGIGPITVRRLAPHLYFSNRDPR